MDLLGRRTLLFTDIEGSTALLQRVGHSRYVELLDRHHRIIREAVERTGGEEIQNEGDAFVVLFDDHMNAITAAVEAQRQLQSFPWPDGNVISVRMGLHEGEIGTSESGHHGMALHEAARVASAAHGRQILLSDAARNVIERDLPPSSDIAIALLGEYSLKDIGRRVPLHQVRHPDLPTDFPPPRTSGGARHNLPGQLTPLVGREDDAATVAELVHRHRLVTLLGAGGVGKTRLALQVGANESAKYPGGVWFTELATLEPGVPLIGEIRRSMRVPDDGNGDQTLVDAIGETRTLLILDNCEHLLDDAADAIDHLLRACPSVHIVATSREPIGKPGEVQWRVPSLEGTSAVDLFVDRVGRIVPDVEFGPDDEQAIASICARLDGIPLAIELVAARAVTIPIGELEGRLLDRAQLLRTSSRGGLRRHQTLQAALEWSYRLLDDRERLLLDRLAVFPGEFEVPAAAEVCSDELLEESDVVELIESLHHKSLVTVDPSAQPTRVTRSEIVRQFSLERLAERGSVDALRERLARALVPHCRMALAGFRSPERSHWLERIDADRDNLGAAFDWLADHDPATAAEVLGCLRDWLVTCDDNAWRRRVVRFAERDDVEPAAIAVSNALRAVLAGGYGFESSALAGDAARRALSHLDAVVDPHTRVRTLTNLALGWREADPDMASRLTDQAVAEADGLGDRSELVASMVELLIVHDEHHATTRTMRDRVLELMDADGETWPSVHPLVDAALADHQIGLHDRAIDELRRAGQLLPPVSHSGTVMTEDAQVWALWSVLVNAEIGEVATAILLAEDALASFGRGDGLAVTTLRANYGQALLLAGRPGDARTEFESALRLVDAWRYISFAIASLGLAMIDIDEGRRRSAAERLAEIASDNRRVWVRARAHDLLGECAVLDGDLLAAKAHLDEAERLRAPHGFTVPPALRSRRETVRRAVAARDGWGGPEMSSTVQSTAP